MDQKLLKKLCSEYNLGELTQSPARLTGGFTHKMYSLFTTKGKYAVNFFTKVRTKETMNHVIYYHEAKTDILTCVKKM